MLFLILAGTHFRTNAHHTRSLTAESHAFGPTSLKLNSFRSGMTSNRVGCRVGKFVQFIQSQGIHQQEVALQASFKGFLLRPP